MLQLGVDTLNILNDCEYKFVTLSDVVSVTLFYAAFTGAFVKCQKIAR